MNYQTHEIMESIAEPEKKEDYITLKWRTLKSWRITSEEGSKLIKKYMEIGMSSSAMMQKDTPEQKQIICQLIDTVPGDIYLDWDGVYVSKIGAKAYVLGVEPDQLTEDWQAFGQDVTRELQGGGR